jgi:hypothetical protein
MIKILKPNPPEYEATLLTSIFWYHSREMGVKGKNGAG